VLRPFMGDWAAKYWSCTIDIGVSRNRLRLVPVYVFDFTGIPGGNLVVSETSGFDATRKAGRDGDEI
jgi:hypothetical protein